MPNFDAQSLIGLPLKRVTPTDTYVLTYSSSDGTLSLQPAAGGGGGGTVTTVSVVTANGLSGTVANPTTTPAITLNITALDAAKIANGNVSNTEFQYLDGVTSAIQTQLDTKVASTRTISTTAPLTGGGDLSSNRTIAITQSDATHDGYLSSTDWNTFNNKQAAGGFTAGSVLFAKNDGTITQNNAYFFWDDTFKGLGIGTTNPQAHLNITDTTRGIEVVDAFADNYFSEHLFSYDGDERWSYGAESDGYTENRFFIYQYRNAAGVSQNAYRFKITDDGKVNFNEEYSFPLADGAASTFLKTDGAGALSFSTVTKTDVGLSNVENTALSTGNAGSATLTAITDDTTTNATMYPTWVTTASGNQAQKVSSSKLSFNPSTGTLITTVINPNSIELGHASDTTITRTGAGAIAVEGVQVILSGAALGTPSSGTLSSCTGLPVSGITSSTVTALGVGSLELGHASDTTLSRSSAGVLAVEGTVVPTISSTNTLTNKRVTPRVSTTTSSATPTINTGNVDMYGLTAQTVDITSFTTNLSGTPTDGQKLWIYIVGTAARAITWGASFEASTVALPTTTVTTNRLDVGFVWNAATSKWRCVATA